MFDYLVLRINESIKTKEFKGIMIGVLDIYGFEIFQVCNSYCVTLLATCDFVVAAHRSALLGFVVFATRAC